MSHAQTYQCPCVSRKTREVVGKRDWQPQVILGRAGSQVPELDRADRRNQRDMYHRVPPGAHRDPRVQSVSRAVPICPVPVSLG